MFRRVGATGAGCGRRLKGPRRPWPRRPRHAGPDARRPAPAEARPRLAPPSRVPRQACLKEPAGRPAGRASEPWCHPRASASRAGEAPLRAVGGSTAGLGSRVGGVEVPAPDVGAPAGPAAEGPESAALWPVTTDLDDDRGVPAPSGPAAATAPAADEVEGPRECGAKVSRLGSPCKRCNNRKVPAVHWGGGRSESRRMVRPAPRTPGTRRRRRGGSGRAGTKDGGRSWRWTGAGGTTGRHRAVPESLDKLTDDRRGFELINGRADVNIIFNH